MRMKSLFFSFFFCLGVLCFNISSLEAREIRQRISAQEYYSKIQEALNKKNWKDLLLYSNRLQKYYFKTSFGLEALYFQGVAYFNTKDFELANEKFSSYLQQELQPKYFDEIMQYKFAIAEKFFQGEKKHLFGLKKMPKWGSGRDASLKIFEEIINTLPSDEMAMRSLFAKGKILESYNDYRESIETYQTLIRRFPKSELSIESYISIGGVYLKQCHPKRQDLNLIGLAEVNAKRFEEAFPNEKRVEEVKKYICQMKEIYAKGLYEIGQFYERTGKPNASIIYYSKIVDNFPDTPSAKFSQKRLLKLEKK